MVSDEIHAEYLMGGFVSYVPFLMKKQILFL